MDGGYGKIHRQTIISRINSLRGLCAIMIVIGHCSMRFEKELLPLILIHKLNMVSVCFFFMASGISLYYNLEYKKEYLKGFIRKKIIVLMIFALIAQLIGEILKGVVLDRSIILNLSIITGWNWYIYEMAVMYLIFYIVSRVVKRLFVREILFWILSLVICLVTLHFYKNRSWEGWTGSYYYSTLSFPLGVSIYLHFDYLRKALYNKPILKCAILVSVAACACICLTMPKDTVLGGIVLRNMLQEHYDEEQLKTALAVHRETWYALSKIKNDKRYAEYIDKISDEELEGGIYMDATLDYIEKRGEKRGAELVVELYQLLANDGRLDEWNEAIKNKDSMIGLLKEYSLLEYDI